MSRDASAIARTIRAQLQELGHRQRAFAALQTDTHLRFLETRQRAMEVLLTLGSQPSGMSPRMEPPGPVPPPQELVPEPSAVSHGRPEGTPVRGPAFSRAQLETHASGSISSLFGPAFSGQDSFARQVRMPMPPLLLVDRVTGLDAEPMSMKTGTIWTETEVRAQAWYLQCGRMPAGIMIEAGQADLMLISYLGVDAENRGERIYRLLGCTVTFHGSLPRIGETLCYDIHLDSHAITGAQRLMFFHYDCRVAGELRLSLDHGQAGFFTDGELAHSEGCLWRPEDQTIVADPRLDPPAVACPRSAFTAEQVAAFAAGRPWDCFGPGWESARAHNRTPHLAQDPLRFIDTVDRFEPRGGPWGRGYMTCSLAISSEAWFLNGHFHNDPCMPGTLMFEGCLQAMAFYLTALGYTLPRDGWRFEPVEGEPFALTCRGQVTPRSRRLVLEVFVEEVCAGPVPMLYADLLGTVDGVKALHARRVGLRLVPGWPLDEGSPLLQGAVDAGPVARIGDLALDFRSLLACAIGRPSEAFGPAYRRFDGLERVARLPAPPYLFMSRILSVEGTYGTLQPGMAVEAAYEIPEDAWYFAENGNPTMPFAVLLEATLQPCGWLACYMGFPLSSPEPLLFRNLDGTGTLHAELRPGCGPLRTRARSTTVSRTPTLVILGFAVACTCDGIEICTLNSVFGFFPAEAFEDQAGLPTSAAQSALFTAPSQRAWLLDGAKAAQGRPRMARPMLLMLDRIDLFEPGGGAAGLGWVRAQKDVDPEAWFFKAHFFRDPVQPGSLGVEAMLQLLQWTMLELGLDEGMVAPRFEPMALKEPMSWKYRGQVVPRNQRITVTLELTQRDRDARGAFARGTAALWVDGKRIYEAVGLGMRIVDGPATLGSQGPKP